MNDFELRAFEASAKSAGVIKIVKSVFEGENPTHLDCSVFFEYEDMILSCRYSLYKLVKSDFNKNPLELFVNYINSKRELTRKHLSMEKGFYSPGEPDIFYLTSLRLFLLDHLRNTLYLCDQNVSRSCERKWSVDNIKKMFQDKKNIKDAAKDIYTSFLSNYDILDKDKVLKLLN